MTRDRGSRLMELALLPLLVAAALVPTRSYDSFWHLATGRWIVAAQALPATDPFALASDRGPWINGEWLFQVAAYALHALGGDVLLSIVRAAAVGGLFFLIYLHGKRHGNAPVAFVLTALAFTAAAGRLDVRPSTCAAFFVAAAIVLLEREASTRRDLLYALLTVVWINTHPSALLAPAIAFLAVALQSTLQAPLQRARVVAAIRIGALSGLALLLNPYGWRAIAAPIALTRFVGDGSFVNAEWLPSLPSSFPLFYLALAAALVVVLYATDRRAGLWRIALAALFALLAVQHVRNQGLFLVAMPLLLAPLAPAIARAEIRRLVVASGAAALLWSLFADVHRPGIDAHRFPVAAVAALRASGLAGNIYNPDQLGGYLIWTMTPPRRVLTDGRNELYRAYLPEYAKARLDGRAWNALLRKYAITLAVDEYRSEPMEVIEPVTHRKTRMPASLVYFPRKQWALIAFDDVAMVFARRSAYPPEVIRRLESPVLAPDAEREP